MNRIKIIAMDVDGTLTDGQIYIGVGGEILKSFNAKDGYAISEILPMYGITPIVITGRESDILVKRCNELGISEVYQNCKDKKKKLLELAADNKLSVVDGIIKGCACIGDDLPDIPFLKVAEVSACPSDAVDSVKKITTYICQSGGGKGAVREFIDWIVGNS